MLAVYEDEINALARDELGQTRGRELGIDTDHGMLVPKLVPGALARIGGLHGLRA